MNPLKNSKIVGLFLVLGLFVTPCPVRSQPQLKAKLPPLPASDRFLPSIQADRIELNLGQRQVRLFRNEKLLQVYPVAVGRPGWETPVGQFQVKTMVVDPSWQHPFEGYVVASDDPNNPLGNRWIGFWTDGTNWVGFHGTSAALRPSVGTAASHGCVRMFDEDIETMYDLVAIGTPVIVTP